jgi:hypothetical protein
MDFALTPEQQSFRDEVRSWLRANLPKDSMEGALAGSDVRRPTTPCAHGSARCTTRGWSG